MGRKVEIGYDEAFEVARLTYYMSELGADIDSEQAKELIIEIFNSMGKTVQKELMTDVSSKMD